MFSDACGFSNSDELLSALKYFHDVGRIAFFSDTPGLEDYVFTKPHWVANLLRVVMRPRQV